MKKLVRALLILFILPHFVSAQKLELLAKKGENGLYIEHKVVPKQSFYSLGRLYNVSPKLIAAVNKLDMNKGLFIDQKIRIPLTDTNFTREGNSGTPVYYKVKEKSNLSDLIPEIGNVSLSNLKSWNELSGEKAKDGAKLIIGFLLSKEMPSITLKNKPVMEDVAGKIEEKPVQKTEEKAVEKVGEKPVEITEEKPAVKGNETQGPPSPGYFKQSFDQQVKLIPAIKTETVTSGIFKTISGWQDGKYYLLMNAVKPGTIVKIINPENNKMVFGKVLGEMSGIRQNQGLNIRISNAAAAALNIKDADKFIVTINY